MKRFYLFLVLLCFFCLAAEPQTYQVTEAQLQKLETIYQNYKANNQKLQEQLNESMEQVQNLKKDSQKLKEQQQNERTLIKNLNESLTKYEINESKRQDQILKLTQDVAERDHKINKLKVACVSLTATAIVLLLAMAAGIYLRARKNIIPSLIGPADP